MSKAQGTPVPVNSKYAETAVVVYGPPGCGKTRNKDALAAHFGKQRIIDDLESGDTLLDSNALCLTDDPSFAEGGGAVVHCESGIVVVMYADIARQLQLDAPAPVQVSEPFSAAFSKLAERQRALPQIRADGVAALTRLLNVARGDSGQCRHIAAFLLGLYNGTRFKFDLTDFRCLDYELFDDCMTVLRMDFQPQREVHCYFQNGGQIWEQLAKDWNIRDYSKRAKS